MSRPDVDAVGACRECIGDGRRSREDRYQRRQLTARTPDTPRLDGRAEAHINRGEAADRWPAGTTFLMDAADTVRRGGTGIPVDWQQAAAAARGRRVVLAGGLTPDNVAAAIDTVRPFGVDVSSGVEDAPGVKNQDKVARFLASARSAFDTR